MQGKVAVLAGSTGLIGSQLLELLLSDNYYEKIIALSRKPIKSSHSKLENIVVTKSDWNAITHIQADDVFCCLGTTIKNAGTKEAFRQVDFEYPLQLAKSFKTSGATGYYLVTALGADKNSSVFYNKVKGEVEAAIAEVGFVSFHIFRPSLLLGDRKEQRAGEDAAKLFYKIFGFLIPNKFKAIDSAKVARAMLKIAKENSSGNFVHESVELQQY